MKSLNSIPNVHHIFTANEIFWLTLNKNISPEVNVAMYRPAMYCAASDWIYGPFHCSKAEMAYNQTHQPWVGVMLSDFISNGKNRFQIDLPGRIDLNLLNLQIGSVIFRFCCYRIYIILPANSNTCHFSFILLLILHHLTALIPLPVDCSSIMTHDWLVFYSMFELWKL